MTFSNDSGANGRNGDIQAGERFLNGPSKERLVGKAFPRRKLKIVMLGAGISGIQFAHDVDTRMHEVDLQIFEKNPELGGTWYENRYPG
ncbi:hypothetical protein ATERTT37_007555 [Aspergillus terreus]